MQTLIWAFLGLAACQEHRQEHEAAEKYPVTTPLRTDTVLTKNYVANIRAIQHIELRSLEKGYLQDIFVDEGAHVKKGTRMFQIMPLLYAAEAQKAGAEANLTEIELNNTKLLHDSNVVSNNELALAKAKLERAKAEMSLASTHKSLTEIRAPFDGIMGRFEARKGSLIGEGDLLTTLSDNSSVWVYFNVSEVEYLSYQNAPEESRPRDVKLLMANGQLFESPGKVETIEADFNNETGAIAYRATFPNPKGLLRHGETGTIQIDSPIKNALVIPQKATFDVLDKKYVFVVDDKNIVHAKAISVFAEKPQLYIVANGLTETDKIVIEGLQKLKDGATIEADFRAPNTVLDKLEVPAE